MTKDYAESNITIAAGPCAVESEEQIMSMALKIGRTSEITKAYGISTVLRAGAWKPRTKCYKKNGEPEFEGTKEQGLAWLASAGHMYGLPVISELMSAEDMHHFEESLDQGRDYIQIGSRNSQSFPLINKIGNTNFGVLIKNPMHGVRIDEALGSIQRLKCNREIIYCMRGFAVTAPEGDGCDLHRKILAAYLEDPNQHADARNLNNIASIDIMRNSDITNVKFWYDPSHTFGGRTELMRRKIGEYAIKALVDFGYDGIIIEVNDNSKDSKCDAEQAMFTTLNNIDWSATHIGKEPELKPLTLVDVLKSLIEDRFMKGPAITRYQLEEDKKRLDEIRWSDRWNNA
jgi:3-deoxy-7-phosphoheptulonate synthase